MGFCGEPEGEPCPMPPIGPGGTPQPPPKGDGQDPYNHCANGECSCGDHDCPPTKSMKPVSTDVKRLGGGPSAGATSENAKKTASIHRSHGATGSWDKEADTSLRPWVKDTIGDVLAWSCFLFLCEHHGPTDPFDVQRKEEELQRKYLVAPFALSIKKPVVSDPQLKNIVRDLYKGLGMPKTIGTGSTADAIRNEVATGKPTYNTWHTEKGTQYMRALENG